MTDSKQAAHGDGPAVNFQDVRISYRDGAQIGPIDLKVPAGSILGLAGGNGAGKTTVLRAACGQVRTASGTIEILGSPLVPGRVPRGVGAMLEEPPLYSWATGREHLKLASDGDPGSEHRATVCLELVGLLSVADAKVRTYSQGMRQRLGIARALLSDPPLLILDEPTNGLDPAAIQSMRSVLRSRVEAGNTILISSHMLAEMQMLADDVVLMAAGQVLDVIHVANLSGHAGALEQAYFDALGYDSQSWRGR